MAGIALKTQREVAAAYAAGIAKEPRGSSRDSPVSMLQALIDLYRHPVYIKQPGGKMFMNEEAALLASDGQTLPAGDANAAEVNLRGKRWRLERHDMNHDTGCILYKLEQVESSEDPQLSRARECMMKMDAFFGVPKLSAPMGAA